MVSNHPRGGIAMKVREIMTVEPACCTPEAPLNDVARLMVGYDCGQVPVVADQKNKKLVGVITDRDIVSRAVAEGKNPLDLTAADCMTSSCVTVSPNTSLADCYQLFEENRVRRLPVVDDDGHCCGIISQADVALHGPRQQTAEMLREVSQPSVAPSAAE
jgi:CBS domain-containing protein